jgi:hypothetical protein
LQVRVYDEATKTLQATLTGGIGYQRVGHSNRVFSLKFCNEDENMLLSAGWDNTVQVMDCICMYAFLCVYIYLYVYTYIHDTFTYMCYICVYMYTCVCVCVCDIYMCVHILSLCVCTCIYRYIQIIHIHIYGAQIWDIYSLCIYVHMYTYIYDISTCMVSGYETRGQMCHSGAF